MSSKLTDLASAPSIAGDDLLYLVPAAGLVEYKATVDAINTVSFPNNVLGSDISLTNTTTLTDVVSIDLDVGTYSFKGTIYSSAGGGGPGSQFALGGTVVFSDLIWWSKVIILGLGQPGAQITQPVDTTNVSFATTFTTVSFSWTLYGGGQVNELEGTIVVTTAGTLKIQGAPTAVSGTTLTLLTGSKLIAQRLAT